MGCGMFKSFLACAIVYRESIKIETSRKIVHLFMKENLLGFGSSTYRQKKCVVYVQLQLICTTMQQTVE